MQKSVLVIFLALISQSEASENAICMVQTKTLQGTGVAVGRDQGRGFILTNAHLFSGNYNQSSRVEFPYGYTTATHVVSSTKADLSLISVKLNNDFEVINYYQSSVPDTLDVATICHEKGNINTTTHVGRLLNQSRLSFRVEPGASGSPVLADGQLVGLITTTSRAVPLNIIKEFTADHQFCGFPSPFRRTNPLPAPPQPIEIPADPKDTILKDILDNHLTDAITSQLKGKIPSKEDLLKDLANGNITPRIDKITNRLDKVESVAQIALTVGGALGIPGLGALGLGLSLLRKAKLAAATAKGVSEKVDGVAKRFDFPGPIDDFIRSKIISHLGKGSPAIPDPSNQESGVKEQPLNTTQLVAIIERIVESKLPKMVERVPITVDSPILPQKEVISTRFVPFETDQLAKALDWAKKELAYKYPQAVDTIEVYDSLINQYLKASKRPNNV